MDIKYKLTEEQSKALERGEEITVQLSGSKAVSKGTFRPTELERFWFFDNVKVSYVTYHKTPSIDALVDSGNCFRTKEGAMRAFSTLVPIIKLLSWVAEHDDGWEPNWGSSLHCKWFVWYDPKDEEWKTDSHLRRKINTVYMSQTNAYKLSQQLNDGRYVL